MRRLTLSLTASDDYYSDDFPPEEYFVKETSIDEATNVALAELLDKGVNETEVDRFIQKHPAFLGKCMNFTQYGHHGIWVLPQKLIASSVSSDCKGLKPDYIVGGRSSDGYSWSVVELKGPQDTLFKRAKDVRRTASLSNEANEGICQLLQYMEYCSAMQGYIRDYFKLKDFREPNGFLIIGRDAEFKNDELLRKMKAIWNKRFGSNIQIRTYDALLRSNPSSWISVEHKKNPLDFRKS